MERIVVKGLKFDPVVGSPKQTTAVATRPTTQPRAQPATHGSNDIRQGIMQTAQALGVDPVDVATAISYETGGTFNPTIPGPVTKYGRHRGLIQFGEPQAAKYGVDWSNPVGSQLGADGAITKYLRDAGVRPGMGLLDIYSAINAGRVGKYGASDAAAGGAPGNVADKVRGMAQHRRKAQALLGGAAIAGGGGGGKAAPELIAKGPNGMPRIVINGSTDPAQLADTMPNLPGTRPFDPMASVKARSAANTQRLDEIAAATPQIQLQQINAQRVAAGQKPLVTMPASKYGKWKEKFDADQPGALSDVGTALWAGVVGLGDIPRGLINIIPGVGPAVVKQIDHIDAWMHGTDESKGAYLDQMIEGAREGYSAKTKAALQKTMFKEITNPDGTTSYGLGDAWSDPRWYLSSLFESVPATVLTMGPGALLAKAKYASVLEQGLAKGLASAEAKKIAAASAAKTATVSGMVSEGITGAPMNSEQTRRDLDALPLETYRQSEAFQQLVKGGMTEDQAKESLISDAGAASFLISGVVDGAFGGVGDRVLAKIISEGVGGSAIKRLVRGVARDVPAEAAEEAAQSAGEQFGENVGAQPIDKRPLTQGVGEAATQGAVTGGIMGGAMGGPLAAASPAEQKAQTPPPAGGAGPPAQTGAAPGAPPGAPPPTAEVAGAQAGADMPGRKKGPLERALDHGEGHAQQQVTKTAVSGGAPPVGTRVQVEGEGASFTGEIHGYGVDGTPHVVDEQGEVHEVPAEYVRPLMPPGKEVTLQPDEYSETPPAEAPAAAKPPAAEPQPAAAPAVTELPRIKPQNVADWISEGIDQARNQADKAGLTAEIERLAYEENTARQVADKLMDRILPLVGGDKSDARTFVIKVRASLGIPSMDSFSEYDAWKKSVEKRYAAKRPAVAPGEVPAPIEPTVEEAPPAAPQAATTRSELPPRAAQGPAADRFPGPPRPGQSVIVDAPGIMPRTPAKVISYEEGATEARVRVPDGGEFQIPLQHLYVDKRTSKEVATAEEKAKPPVKREKQAGPTLRQVATPKGEPRTVEFPDELSARVYDVGAQRTQAKQLGGISNLDLDKVNPTAQQAIADELGVSMQAAGQIAEDYRYRAQQAARTARSNLPQKVQPIPKALLKRHQSEHAKQQRAAKEPSSAPPPAAEATGAAAGPPPPATASPEPRLDIPAWWDDKLTDAKRKAVLAQAGIKRSPKTLWKNLPVNLQSKIVDAMRRGLETHDLRKTIEQEGEEPAQPEPKKAPEAQPEPKKTAPEHARAEGKKLEREVVYEPTATGSQLMKGSVAGDVIDLPVDQKAFAEITDEWAALFAAPAGPRVNMDKVAEKEPAMSVDDAQKRVDGWKARAAEQAKDPAIRGENFNKTILSLFDYTGEWSRPYEEAGYNVIRFDIQNGQDVFDFSVDWFNENYDISDVHGILVACPCTDFASSGARHFAAKDADGRTEASKELVFQALRTIEYFRPKFWVLENPVGRIESLTGLPPARLTFNPWNFGAPYTKKTMLWGQFNTDLPVAPVEPTEGSKMHRMFGGKSLKTKNARSETPEGFAYSFFMANNFADANPIERTVADYPEASGAVRAAMEAGISEQEVRDAMYKTYENYEYEDARSELARMTAEKKTGKPVERPAPVETPKPAPAPEPGARLTAKQHAEQARASAVAEIMALANAAGTAGRLEKPWREPMREAAHKAGIPSSGEHTRTKDFIKGWAEGMAGDKSPPSASPARLAGYNNGAKWIKANPERTDTVEWVLSVGSSRGHTTTFNIGDDRETLIEFAGRIGKLALSHFQEPTNVKAKARAKAAPAAAATPAPAAPAVGKAAGGTGQGGEREGVAPARKRTIARDTSIDTSASTKQRYTDLGIDSLVLTGHPGDAARDEVQRRGKASKRESLVVLDAHGDVVANGEGGANNTGMTRRIQDILENPDERVVLHHNHPSDFGLSSQDIAVARKAGIAAIYAHASDGISYRVAFTPAAKMSFGARTTAETIKLMDKIMAPLVKVLTDLAQANAAQHAYLNREVGHLRAMAMRDAGLIDYATTTRPDSALLENPAIRQLYDKAVSAFAATIRGKSAPGHRGRAGSSGHPGELSEFHRVDAGAAAKPAAEPGDQAGAGPPAAKPAKVKAAAKPKKPTKAELAAREHRRQLEDYFSPGNIVHGYGSQHDRVLGFEWRDGNWKVAVQHVVQRPTGWEVAPHDKRVREHQTMPSKRELARGPVVRRMPSGWTQDNPGARGDEGGKDWLRRKQAYAEEDAKAAGGPLRKSMTSGPTTATAGQSAPLFLPVHELRKLPGVMGEHGKRVPGEHQYNALLKSVQEKGYSNENPVFVMVNHKGEAFINEGNTRLAVAEAMGVQKVKVWVNWKNGGELAPGDWTPGKVSAMELEAEKLPGETPAQPPQAGGLWNTGTEAFRNWFGKSQVVQPDGKPRVVYHGSVRWDNAEKGTSLGNFRVFDRMASVTQVGRAPSMDTVGSWFSDLPDKQGAGAYGGGETGTTYPVYLRIENPWRPKSFDEFLDKMHTTAGRDPSTQDPKGRGSTEELRAWLKSQGYDGIRFPTGTVDGKQQTVWIALDPGQIKSVFNPGTFSREDLDILAQEEERLPGTTPQPGPTGARIGRRVMWLDTFQRPLPVSPTGGTKGTVVMVKDIGRAFDREHMKRIRRKLFPESSKADYARVAQMAREEMRDQLPRENSGVGWYGKDVEDAINLTARVFPTLATEHGHRELYLTFAGIFSNGTNPEQAWGMSAEAFAGFLATGEIPVKREDALRAGGKPVVMTTFENKAKETITRPAGWGIRSAANEQQLAFIKWLVKREGSLRGALDWMLTRHPRADINTAMLDSKLWKEGRFVTKDEKAGGPEHGTLAFGEKLGRYMLGLQGLAEGEADTTVDLWFTRTFRRWTGRLFDPPIGKEGIAAQPSNPVERNAIFRLAGDMAREFNLTPGDVQAVLWFFEKRLWGAHGLSTEEGTNSSGARRLLRSLWLDVGEGSGGPGVPGAAQAGVRAVRRNPRKAAGPAEPEEGLSDDSDELGHETFGARARRGLADVIPDLSKVRHPSEWHFRDRVKSAWDKMTPAMLSTVYLNYLPDLAAKSIKPLVARYIDEKRKMDTMRGVIHKSADDVVQDWRKYSRLGKDKVQALAELMHDATKAGVDPDNLDHLLKPEYAALRDRFMAMPESGRELYRKVRDKYEEQSNMLDAILVDNLRKAHEIAERKTGRELARKLREIQRDPKLTDDARRQKIRELNEEAQAKAAKGGWSMRYRVTKLRQLLEQNKVKPPYFPLGRFGKHYVSVRDADKKLVHFALAESLYRNRENERLARREFPGLTVKTGLLQDKLSSSNVPGGVVKPSFIAELEAMLGNVEGKDAIMDQIWQRYLRSMPDLSIRSRRLHRSMVSGHSGDALRVFANHMFHSAHQMARLKHGMELGDIVDETGEVAQEAPETENVQAQRLATELGKRHGWVMNPTGNSIAQIASTSAFSWYLAASPAAAMINLAQTPMVGIPILAGKFGSFSKAGAAIVRASKNAISNKGLNDGELNAMKAWEDMGLIDNTQVHDLAGVGETGVSYSPVRARVMHWMSLMFHKAEVMNRRATALAAYRLATEAGQTFHQAVKTASDLTWRTHFDYANSSRPRIMQNPVAKVVLSMRSYQINMLYRLGRDIHQSLKGATPAERREARYQLAGILGMQALVAGGGAVAGYNTAFFVYGIMSTIFASIFGGGDDGDDPFTAEEKFRQHVLDLLGPELGGIVLNGVAGHFLNVDLASRVGMPDLWFRSPNKDIESGQDAYNYILTQSAGAPFGILETLLNSYDYLSKGQKERAAEAAVPKSLKDLLKSYRYMSEGVATAGGEPVIERDDVGYWSIIATAMGFTPASVAEKWDQTSTLKNAEKRVKINRQAYINGYAMAVKTGDEAGRQEAIEKIRKFNGSTYGRTMPIKGSTLAASIKQRAIRAGKRERGGGVLITNEALGRALRTGAPEAIY